MLAVHWTFKKLYASTLASKVVDHRPPLEPDRVSPLHLLYLSAHTVPEGAARISLSPEVSNHVESAGGVSANSQTRLAAGGV